MDHLFHIKDTTFIACRRPNTAFLLYPCLETGYEKLFHIFLLTFNLDGLINVFLICQLQNDSETNGP